LLIIFIGIRFYIEPIVINTPSEITFNDLSGNKNLGQIVKIKGQVDYTLAYTKDVVVTDQRGNISLTSQEVFLPLFSPDDSQTFIVIQGGKKDLRNIASKIGVTDSALLKNQDYEVIGRIQTIDDINNKQLLGVFTENLPSIQSLNPPKILLNSAEIISINDFINRYTLMITVVLFLLISSTYLQFYIDRRLLEKQKF
jgi:hypothetical protein